MKINKRYKIILSIMLICIFIFPLQALGIDYKDISKKMDVNQDKIWTIKFNKDVDKNTITSKNILVLDDKSSQVDIKVECKDSKTVLVSPVNQYEPGKTYTLMVKDSVKSKDGQNLKLYNKMVFTTKENAEKPVYPGRYIVALDPGRAANDIGAEVGPTGIKGKDINLDVALKAGKILEQNGVQVVYTRKTDAVSWSKEDSIYARSKIVNDSKANILVSIHCNVHGSTSVSGVETYYLKGHSQSKKLATYVQNELSSKIKLPNRGIIESELKTLSSVNATAVYTDLGFLSNPAEEKVLNSPQFKDSSAEAIANAVMNYLNIKSTTYINIKHIKDITLSLHKDEKYILPTQVTALMSDNTNSKVSVKWDKSYIDTSKEGTYYFKGTVTGYSGVVNLKVVVTSNRSSNTGVKVCIDPAGASNILGVTGPNGVKDKDVNLAVALKVGKLLENKGMKVIYTRTTDSVAWNESNDTEQRYKIANNSGAKFFISINCNSYVEPSANGAEVYYLNNDYIGEEFAKCVQNNIISLTGGKDRGIRPATKGRMVKILKEFKGTGIFVYPGFITNVEEGKLLETSVYQDKIAQAIVNSILKTNVSTNVSTNESIKSINNITVNLNQGNSYFLPSKVSAINNNGKIVQVNVTWEKSSIDTSKVGTFKIIGRVKDYNKPVTLTIIVSPKGTKRYKVVIDPGHGGYDSGAVGPKGTKEKDLTLAVSLKLGSVLAKSGIDVVYTRTSDNVPWPSNKNVELQTRCDIANNVKADYFVSIHCNSADVSSVTGIETYYDRNKTNGIALAKNIQKELIAEFGAKDRGIKGSGLYVVKNTNMPAVLVELEFMSNTQKEQMLKDAKYQQRYAEAIARGIKETLGK